MSNLIEQLEKKLEKKFGSDGREKRIKMEEKHFNRFAKQSQYLGNGIYTISGTNRYSTDTRELFLMFVCDEEGIKFDTEK
jgi:hypothetical protein